MEFNFFLTLLAECLVDIITHFEHV